MITNEELSDELSMTLQQLNEQVTVVFAWAREAMVNPFRMKYPDGKFVLAPILEAKATVLSSMVELKKMEGS